MSFLSDIFNSTFLIFLGILLLVVALLFLYFENKFREQNHKISSMFSLVSSITEELNNVRFGLNHISMIGAGMQPTQFSTKHLEETPNDLILVSDDEDDEDDDDDEDEDDEDEDEDDDDDDHDEDDVEDNSGDNEVNEEEEERDSDSDNDTDNINEYKLDDIISNELEEVENTPYVSNNDIKILKLNLGSDLNNYTNENDIQEIEDGEVDLDDIIVYHNNNDYNNDDENNNNNTNDNYESYSDFKTININLEEHKNTEIIDYKKLPLNKLRNTVQEKGLATDASKLKKNEMLKLLGIE
jgi:hypothetical protein